MLTKSLLHSTPIDLAREMDRLFDSMVGTVARPVARGLHWRGAFPPINVWEDEGHLYAEAELPGVAPESLDISVAGDELTIAGKRESKIAETSTLLRSERMTGSFERTIQLPMDIDAEHVDASLRDGVLMITLPKTVESKPRRIEVKSSTSQS